MRKLVMMVVMGTLLFIGRLAIMGDGGAGAMEMLSSFTGGSGYSTSTSSTAGGAKFVSIKRDAPPPESSSNEPGFMDKYVWSNEMIVEVLAKVGLERPETVAASVQTPSDLQALRERQSASNLQLPAQDAALAAMAEQLEAALAEGALNGELAAAVPSNLMPVQSPGAKFVSSR